jgi:hypothetical protein
MERKRKTPEGGEQSPEKRKASPPVATPVAESVPAKLEKPIGPVVTLSAKRLAGEWFRVVEGVRNNPNILLPGYVQFKVPAKFKSPLDQKRWDELKYGHHIEATGTLVKNEFGVCDVFVVSADEGQIRDTLSWLALPKSNEYADEVELAVRKESNGTATVLECLNGLRYDVVREIAGVDFEPRFTSEHKQRGWLELVNTSQMILKSAPKTRGFKFDLECEEAISVNISSFASFEHLTDQVRYLARGRKKHGGYFSLEKMIFPDQLFELGMGLSPPGDILLQVYFRGNTMVQKTWEELRDGTMINVTFSNLTQFPHPRCDLVVIRSIEKL